MAVANNMLVQENQKTTVKIEAFETEQTHKLMEKKQLKAKSDINPVKVNSQKAEQTTIKSTDIGVADEKNTAERNELEKPLDLSVPFRDSENADLKIEQKSSDQSQVNNIFAPETKKKPRSLELDGNFLMSPEPEVEKRKSVDGAGIIIKLKP
jgi:hypothetical protein